MSYTAKQAADILRKAKPDVNIINCCDYGKEFLFTAPKNGSKNDIDPFYLIDKNTGAITGYTIAEDPDKYYSAKDVNFD